MRDIFLYIFSVPTVLIVLSLIILYFLFNYKYKEAKKLGIITLSVAIIFSSHFTGELLSYILIKGVEFKKIKSLDDVDMIVMPTQGIEYNGKLLGWVPSLESFKAGNIAYNLQNKITEKRVPVAICGGNMGSGVIESEVIKGYFDNQTAKIKKTIIEDVSTTLPEQVWQCTNLIKRYNSKNPVLVVDELKMLRTLALFRERGIEMVPFPVFSVQSKRSIIQRYLPSLDGLILNQQVIKELMNVVIDIVGQKVSFNKLFYNPGE